MHSEKEIRKVIKELLVKYVKMDTSEIKSHLNEVLEFDDDDKEMSSTRPGEALIFQRIGNIVSHQEENIKIYDEGFMLDKNDGHAMWYMIDADNEEESNKDIPKEQKGKKIDWQRKNKKNSEIGKMGEIFVYDEEVEKVNEIDPELIKKVIHVSAKVGDGAGYDILSLNEKKDFIYIEVKTTTSKNPDESFFISQNEVDFFKKHLNDAFIYRVYDFNVEERFGKIKIISAEELFNDFDFIPNSYVVKKK